MLGAALTGFGTAFSLILAIGAQNAFVLRQGLQRSHVFVLCLFCALSDALLIAAGVAGFGYLVTVIPWFPKAMALAGAAFLIVYGLARARAAVKGGGHLDPGKAAMSRGKVLAVAAALTWLNPHVYLDTLGLIGAISTQYHDLAQKIAFGVGAMLSSFTFFFGLGYGARLLSPVMAKPAMWQALDALISLTMWTIAAKLLAGALG